MIHLGNVPASTTIYVPFTTYAGSTGASVTCTGLAVTDVEIYKNGSTTQRSSDAGIALLDTDGIDFDGITGLHGFSIDLSDNTDASFYAVGSWYWVVVSAITVDSQTVTFLAATFRIAPAEALTGHPKTDVGGWLGTAPATPTVNGVPEVDVTHFNGTAGTFSSGRPEVNSTHFAGTAYATALAAEVDAVWDEVLTAAAHNVANSSGRRLRLIDAALEVHSGTAQAGSTSTTFVMDTGASATDDIYNGDRIVIIAGTGAEEHGLIIDYVGSTRTATMAKAWVVTPDATSEFAVLPADCDVETWNHLPTVALPLTPTVAGRALDVSAGGEAGIDWANIGSPTTTVNLSATNIDVDQVVASVSGAVGSVTTAVTLPTIPTDWITADGIAADAIGASELAADAVTEIQSGLSTLTQTQITGGAYALNSASFAFDAALDFTTTQKAATLARVTLVDTATTLTNLPAITANWLTAAGTASDFGDEIADAVLTRQMTESYAADNVAPTLAQALFLVQQAITEFTISGTTTTIKKIDGTTTAATLTLNDGTTPTGVTRAT